MKERPILFSSPMIRALLDGRKTMTRRVVKPQPPRIAGLYPEVWHDRLRWYMPPGELSDVPESHCPYGQLGDRLWVKETWCCKMDNGEFVYRPDGHHDCYYRATETEHIIKDDGNGGMKFREDGREASPWISPLFMPRWASRITLELTAVRVERVQDVSHRDALAEGVAYDVSKEGGAPVPRFKELWDSLNSKRGFGWEQNPWVWVLSFRVVKPTSAIGDPDAIDRAEYQHGRKGEP